MDNGFDRNAPATKGDVQDFRGDLENFRVEVNARFHEFEHRMEQFILDAEGRIITSNYRLAESIQQRLNQTEGNQGAIIARLATLDTRITEVEKRLNMPPQT